MQFPSSLHQHSMNLGHQAKLHKHQRGGCCSCAAPLWRLLGGCSLLFFRAWRRVLDVVFVRFLCALEAFPTLCSSVAVVGFLRSTLLPRLLLAVIWVMVQAAAILWIVWLPL